MAIQKKKTTTATQKSKNKPATKSPTCEVTIRQQRRNKNPLNPVPSRQSLKKAGVLPEDYPLTLKERKFVDELKLAPNNVTEAYRKSYTVKDMTAPHVRVKAHELLRKPSVAKVVKREIGEELLKYGANATAMLQRAALIAMADVTDIARFEGGRIKIIEDKDLSPGGRALLQEISETVTADGSITLKVKAKDQFNYFKLMCQYFSVLDKANQTPYKPHKEQVAMLEAIMNGNKTPVDAALYLESQGIPLPETIRLLISKQQPEVDPMDDVKIPTAEEIWERRKAKMKEIEEQREGLPQVREEVAQIKRELGDKVEAFKPEIMGDGE